MSLFGDLPAPQRDAISVKDLDELKDESDEEDNFEVDPGIRRLGATDQPIPSVDEHKAEVKASTAESASADVPADQITSALVRITNHISQSSKFLKASGLLRQLLDANKVKRVHKGLLFAAVKQAFSDRQQVRVDAHRREYVKLLRSIDAYTEFFNAAEHSQIQVYTVLGDLQNQLYTDDSFVFNKVVGQLKELISQLTETTLEDDQSYEVLERTNFQGSWSLPKPNEDEAPPPKKKVKVEEPPEDDIFGIGGLMEQMGEPGSKSNKTGRPSKAAELCTSWTWQESQCMMREALLDCMETAKGRHKLAWAQVSVELLLEHLYQHRDRFTSQQRPRVTSHWTFVQTQRAARRSGKSNVGQSDMTSFERDRAEWSKATLSARGKVGGGGDNKAQNWLG